MAGDSAQIHIDDRWVNLEYIFFSFYGWGCGKVVWWAL